MRSYRQYCALAKALDVIGDRWALLIVRELLLRGSCRYTDLRAGLPGIATNMLVDRLRELERSGVVERQAAPPPVATTLFRLTPWGEQLRPVVHALGQWAAPLLAESGDDDIFQSHWLAIPAELYLTDHTPDRPSITIEVRTGDEPLIIETLDGEVRIRPGPAEAPDASLSGPPRLILGVLTGNVDLAEARSLGLQYEGDPKTLRRVLP